MILRNKLYPNYNPTAKDLEIFSISEKRNFIWILQKQGLWKNWTTFLEDWKRGEDKNEKREGSSRRESVVRSQSGS